MAKCKNTSGNATLFVQIQPCVNREAESHTTDSSFIFNSFRDIMNTFVIRITRSVKEQVSWYLNTHSCPSEFFCLMASATAVCPDQQLCFCPRCH